MKPLLPLIFILYIVPFIANAGIVKGKITNNEGEPLAFATIYISEIKTGTTANGEGDYFVKLTPGNYTLVFQYMGYQSVTHEVQVSENQEVNLDVKMITQDIVLPSVTINAKNEDPAYAIIRNAIAKSKFHLNQIDSSTSKVYLKGSGKLLKIPFLLRKRFKDEGIDTSKIYLIESITKVTYKRPNQYKEEVIAMKSNLDDLSNTSPMAYINASFYHPEVANTISPLSPKAFSYYNFTYLGTYVDRGYEISKVKVTPRSKGDNVFEGVIEIVEDNWSIYSLKLNVVKMGINIAAEQMFAPIESSVWLPVSHKYHINGKIWGVGFQFKYLAAVSDYQIHVNPDLPRDVTLVPKEVVDSKTTNIRNLEEKDKVTRKDINKALRKYEKEEAKKSDEPDVVYDHTMVVDSLAAKRDSLYWITARPIQLASDEIQGYQQQIVRIEKTQSDTVDTINNKKTNYMGFITGRRFQTGKNSDIQLQSVLSRLDFNTVEGYNATIGLSYNYRWPNNTQFSIGPDIRYSFARNKLSGVFNMKFQNHTPLQQQHVFIRGGREVAQYNEQNPVSPFLNSIWTLLFYKNYLKIYERDFLEIDLYKNYGGKIKVGIKSQLSERWELFNHSKIIEREETRYTPNAPENLSLENTSFPQHRAFISSATVQYQPWVKYVRQNGNKSRIPGTGSTFRATYTKGFGDVDFDKLLVGINHQIKIGVRAAIDLDVEAGSFLNKETIYLMDFFHFDGNKLPFLRNSREQSFRLLDYYLYSTDSRYLQSHVNYKMRKFLLTRIPAIQMMGLRENLIGNLLLTPEAGNYMELGYGLDHIFRIFRVEAVSSFHKGKFESFGIRVGMITSFNF